MEKIYEIVSKKIFEDFDKLAFVIHISKYGNCRAIYC